MNVLTDATLGTILVELLKLVVRLVYSKQGKEVEFSKVFYLIALPIASFLAQPLLAFLGVDTYTLPVDVLGWTKELVVVGISAVVSSGIYNIGLYPIKQIGKAVG